MSFHSGLRFLVTLTLISVTPLLANVWHVQGLQGDLDLID